MGRERLSLNVIRCLYLAHIVLLHNYGSTLTLPLIGTLNKYILPRVRILPREESGLGLALASLVNNSLLGRGTLRFGEVNDALVDALLAGGDDALRVTLVHSHLLRDLASFGGDQVGLGGATYATRLLVLVWGVVDRVGLKAALAVRTAIHLLVGSMDQLLIIHAWSSR